jgi:hypothetical protein
LIYLVFLHVIVVLKVVFTRRLAVDLLSFLACYRCSKGCLHKKVFLRKLLQLLIAYPRCRQTIQESFSDQPASRRVDDHTGCGFGHHDRKLELDLKVWPNVGGQPQGFSVHFSPLYTGDAIGTFSARRSKYPFWEDVDKL